MAFAESRRSSLEEAIARARWPERKGREKKRRKGKKVKKRKGKKSKVHFFIISAFLSLFSSFPLLLFSFLSFRAEKKIAHCVFFGYIVRLRVRTQRDPSPLSRAVERTEAMSGPRKRKGKEEKRLQSFQRKKAKKKKFSFFLLLLLFLFLPLLLFFSFFFLALRKKLLL